MAAILSWGKGSWNYVNSGDGAKSVPIATGWLMGCYWTYKAPNNNQIQYTHVVNKVLPWLPGICLAVEYDNGLDIYI